MSTSAETAVRFSTEARAKLNLRLEVKGLRDDGYHEIASVFHEIALSDEVAVTVKPSPPGDPFVDVHCEPHTELGGTANIAYRAASLYLAAWAEAVEDAGRSVAVAIDIRKRIPVAAGLGGGSSDAAAVLRLLHESLRTAGRAVDLPRVAAMVGSDVPFFLRGGVALVEGRGELVTPLQSGLDLPLLLAVPPFGVSARDAYAWWDCDCHAESAVRTGFLRNDLMGPVAKRFPLVGDLIHSMIAAGAFGASMTGSGPVVYGIFNDASAVAGAEAVLRQSYPDVGLLISRFCPTPEDGRNAVGRVRL